MEGSGKDKQESTMKAQPAGGGTPGAEDPRVALAAARAELEKARAEAAAALKGLEAARAEAAREAVLAYEARHGLADGQPAGAGNGAVAGKDAGADPGAGAEGRAGGQPEAGGDTGAEAPAWAARVGRLVESLAARLGALEAARLEAARRGEVRGLVERLPEPLRAAYERLPLAGLSEAGWAAERARVEREVEGIVQSLTARGYSFTPPRGLDAPAGAPRGASEGELKDVLMFL